MLAFASLDFQKSRHLLDKRTTDVSDAEAIYDYSQEWVKSKVIINDISHFFKLHSEFYPFFFQVQTYVIKEYLDSSCITKQLQPTVKYFSLFFLKFKEGVRLDK